MADDRVEYWIGVNGLMAVALILGQAPAVSVAALVGVCLACRDLGSALATPE